MHVGRREGVLWLAKPRHQSVTSEALNAVALPAVAPAQALPHQLSGFLPGAHPHCSRNNELLCIILPTTRVVGHLVCTMVLFKTLPRQSRGCMGATIKRYAHLIKPLDGEREIAQACLNLRACLNNASFSALQCARGASLPESDKSALFLPSRLDGIKRIMRRSAQGGNGVPQGRC